MKDKKKKKIGIVLNLKKQTPHHAQKSFSFCQHQGKNICQNETADHYIKREEGGVQAIRRRF